MSFIDTLKGRVAIGLLAEREGKSYAEIEATMQQAIDYAWANAESREFQDMLFPEGKPTAAEFIGRTAKYIKDNPDAMNEEDPS